MPKNRKLKNVIMGHHIQDGAISAADMTANIAVNVTTAGGAATEALTVSGVTTSSVIVASLKDDGTNNVTLKTAKATAANTVTCVFSADPGNDAIVSILAF